MPHQADYRLLWVLGLRCRARWSWWRSSSFTRRASPKTPACSSICARPMATPPSTRPWTTSGRSWWFWLHMIQTPDGLSHHHRAGHDGWANWWREEGCTARLVLLSAWGARIALFVFAVYYTALDAIGGIGLGRTLETVNHLKDHESYRELGQRIDCLDGAGQAVVCLDPHQMEGVTRVLNLVWVDPWVGGVGSVVSLTGSWAIFSAAVLTALTMLLARGLGGMDLARWLSLICLVAGAWFVQVSHACCTGPLGFGLIFLFGCLTWWSSIRAARG